MQDLGISVLTEAVGWRACGIEGWVLVSRVKVPCHARYLCSVLRPVIRCQR